MANFLGLSYFQVSRERENLGNLQKEVFCIFVFLCWYCSAPQKQNSGLWVHGFKNNNFQSKFNGTLMFANEALQYSLYNTHGQHDQGKAEIKDETNAQKVVTVLGINCEWMITKL